MQKISLSQIQKNYIKKNYLKISGTDIAKTLNVGKGVVQRFIRNNNLWIPKSTISNFKSIAINKTLDLKIHEYDSIITNEYLKMPIKTLARKINKSDTYVKSRLKRLGLIIPEDIIQERKIASRKKPGDIPKNKGKRQIDYMSRESIEKTAATRFKKGQIPHNAVGFKDLDIVTRNGHKDRNSPPYKWIRLSLGKWEMYHVYLWKQHNGQIPDGHIIVFKDKNTLNTVIDNLECITKKENMIRNSIHQYPEEIKKTIQTLSVVTRKINKYEKQNQ